MAANISSDKIDLVIYGPIRPILENGFPDQYVVHRAETGDQLKDRIARTLAFVKGLDAKAIDASAEREITFPLGGQNKGQMKGADYLNHFVLPNFYFHCTAAYAVARNFGADIGKRDFLGGIPLKRI